MIKILKKVLKYTLWFVLGVLLIVNLAIVVTGKFYIYKGFSASYLQGHLQPTIYDDDVFKNRVISNGTSQNWINHPRLGQIKMSQKQHDYIENLGPASFLITWGDTIIYEEYFEEHNAQKLSNSFSMAKSVVALLIGAAVEDGFIKSIDEPVANYLEEFKDQTKNEITIRHFLTMSSGLSWDENYFNPFGETAELYYDTDARDLVLNRREVESEPGKVFKYSSADTQTLVYILMAATGKSAAEYATEKIWSKIGAESDAQWSLVGDENSEEKSYCCIYATTRDFARLGKLINQNGKWGEEQLINEDYVKAFKAVAPLQKQNGKPNQLYGFQYWIYTGLPYEVTYYRGMLGQYIISIPEFELVIVRTGNGVGDRWVNTDKVKDDALEGHRVELPVYISTAMAIYAQAKE
ncbi:MAG: serine hydrolase domain-containing protein [Putridiphycobacter sp.]